MNLHTAFPVNALILGLVFGALLSGCGETQTPHWAPYRVTLYSSNGRVIKSWLTSNFWRIGKESRFVDAKNGEYVFVSGNVVIERDASACP